jgi:4-amino-4-deoxy-L-arabinose transferase-like glycosyltransferase
MFTAKNQQSLLLRIKRYIYKHPAGCLVFLLLLSLGLKILAYKADPLLSRDAALYCLMAQTWYESGSYQEMLRVFPGTGWIPPGFLWCLKSLMATGLPIQNVGLVFNILCGLLLIPIGYGLAWEIFHKKKIALITAAFFAVLPPVNQLSIEIIRDISSLCLTGTVLWLALAGIRRKNWICLTLSALTAGINFLFRYESIECIPIIGIVLTILVIKRNFPWKKAVVFSGTWFLMFVISFVVCVSCIGKKDFLISYNRYLSGKIINVANKLSEVFNKGEKSK